MSTVDDKYANLTPEDIADIKQSDEAIAKLMNLANTLKDLQDYKVGDIYIRQEWNEWHKQPWVHKNQMGFPLKYKVVHISAYGIPYLRQLTSNGKPTGPALTPPHKTLDILDQIDVLDTNGGHQCKFVPDPEALDAILLQQEFDPMAAQKERVKLFNEINKHNKKVTIKTSWSSGWQHIAYFFQSLKPGDKFYTAIDKAYVLQSVTKVGKEWQIVAVDQNQATKTFNFSHFQHKRLYSALPRSFSKESKT